MGAPVWQSFCVPFAPFLVPQLVWNISMHQYMNICPPDCPCQLHPIWTVSWKHGWPRVALCVFHNQPISSHTPLLECVHASVHVYMSIWLYFIFTPLCIVTWNNLGPFVPLFDYSSNPIFGPTPCLENVHALVHVLLSTWHLMSASPHLHTYMERGVPLCGTVFVFQSSTSGPTPCLKCTHASVH